MDFSLFQKFRSLVYQQSGISLSDQKASLVSMRIAKRIRTLGLNSEKTYYEYLIQPENQDEVIHFINAISTNVTHFFRENEHFEILSKELKTLKEQGQREIKIWSAASSSGEEPYTIAMIAAEVFEGSLFDVKVLATDICTEVLHKAMTGYYELEKVKTIPQFFLKKYFEAKENGYEVKQKLKNMILFRKLNLKNQPLPLKGPIDIIFCRNVMIYFDQDLKRQIVENMFQILKPGGKLFISHTESLAGISNGFKLIRPSVFAKPTWESTYHANSSDLR